MALFVIAGSDQELDSNRPATDRAFSGKPEKPASPGFKRQGAFRGLNPRQGRDKEMKAKDLMMPLREYLKVDNTLREVAVTLRTAKGSEEKIGVKGLPVLDGDGKMVGFLSMWDILKAVFPAYLSKMDLGHFTWDGMVENISRKVGGKKVSEMMTEKVISVTEDAPLMECVGHMLKENVKRLPVIDKDGRVVGIIYERDVFLAITGAILEENAGGAK
jgi:CBS domain-containing protein